jgi:16S rRNA (adenine1518-N6/adenine1519-N6)-dimethyltransferase
VARARKRFGQHFLEPAWVEKLLRVISPSPADHFLEIGPGRGALTLPLAAVVSDVVAYEIDRDLAAALSEIAPPNVSVVEGDFLDATPGAFSGHLRRVAGNLPYNVASRILFKLGDLYTAGARFADATVMLQREVADRLLAPPGSRDYGVLSVLVRHGAEVDRLLVLPPGAFRPVPKVHSAVVRLRFHDPVPVPKDPRGFRAMTQAVFTRRRKTLTNALLAFPDSARMAPADALKRAGIDGRRRPETLGIDELVRLADTYVTAVL